MDYILKLTEEMKDSFVKALEMIDNGFEIIKSLNLSKINTLHKISFTEEIRHFFEYRKDLEFRLKNLEQILLKIQECINLDYKIKEPYSLCKICKKSCDTKTENCDYFIQK